MTEAFDRRALHALRLGGVCDTERVAVLLDLDIDSVRAGLDALGERRLIRWHEGELRSWMLTPTGRAEGERLLGLEIAEAGVAEAVTDAYGRFRDLNRPFLALCTDWQVRRIDGELVTNDHTDAPWDDAVIVRLGEMHERIAPVCRDLTRALGRFGRYLPRLEAARRRIVSGEVEWFTRPVIDSYHTVWMELHEDLLASLGLDRAKEAST